MGGYALPKTYLDKHVVVVDDIKNKGGIAPFSPSYEGLFNFETDLSENALFYLILYQIAKTNPEKAYKLLETIVMQSSAILQDFVRAGSANYITAFASSRAVAYWMERMGMFTKAQALDYHSGLAVMAGLQVANQWKDLIPWVRESTDTTFPDQVHLGDKTVTTVTSPTGKVTTTEVEHERTEEHEGGEEKKWTWGIGKPPSEPKPAKKK